MPTPNVTLTPERNGDWQHCGRGPGYDQVAWGRHWGDAWDAWPSPARGPAGDGHTRLQRPHYRVGTPSLPGIGPLSPLQPFWPALASRWPHEPEGRALVITCGTLTPELIATVTSASLTKRRPGGHRARCGRRQCVTLVRSARPVRNCPHTCIILMRTSPSPVARESGGARP
jgi:hypothetical protein